MADSPASRTPYEVLGVSSAATQDELRRAYRRMLRETHPDTGGTALRFHEVQVAWERVGRPSDREAYDRGHSSSWAQASGAGFARAAAGGDPGGTSTGARTAQSPRAQASNATGSHTAGFDPGFSVPRTSGSVRARSYGYPGGRSREQFVVLMREWVGRGVAVDDVFDPALVQSAPREIRRQLAKAIAEEATWSLIVELGIGYTVWNDLDTAPRGTGKIDHVVLGPAGLFAVQSEDWGGPVRVLRGELTGDGVDPRSEPLRDLERDVRALARSLRVAFTATVMVVPDDDLDEAIVRADRGRRSEMVLARRSALPGLLRNGIGGSDRTSVDRIFELRSQLQERIRFV